MRLPDFEAWAIFAKISEFGSFARAAEEIQLSKPTVSKAISRLEHALGIVLFNRNSRHISLTETGRSLLGHANRIVAEAEAAEIEARGDMQRPSGRIRIAAPVTFGIQHLAPVLPAFIQSYPEIYLNVSFSDAIVDMVADGYDVALRISSLADSSLRARKLCDVGLFLVASPAWLDAVGRPEHPRDLETCKSFIYTNTAAPGMIRLREKGSRKEFVLAQTARFRADNAEAFLPSLEAGQGYGLFPEFMIWDGLQGGRLERILPAWEGPVVSLYLITPPNPIRPNRVKVLLDYLVKAFEHPPWAKSATRPELHENPSRKRIPGRS